MINKRTLSEENAIESWAEYYTEWIWTRVCSSGSKHSTTTVNRLPKPLDFLLLAQSMHLYLQTCVLPHTPPYGVARIFSLTPMPWPGIKLTSALLHLSFWGTLIQDALPTEPPCPLVNQLALLFQGGRRSSLELELHRYSARADTVKKIGDWSRLRLSQQSSFRHKNQDRVT